MRLLIGENDRVFGDALTRHLMREGYAVDWCQSGAAVVQAVSADVYDCLLFDLTLPDMSGFDLIRTVRSLAPHVPGIAVTARCSKSDRIGMLDLGADDFLAKPVDLDEVTARIRALTRRCPRSHHAKTEFRHGPLRLDPACRTATWYDRAVALTNKEYWLLETFVKHRQQVLTRGQLEQTLYGWSDTVDSNAVEVYIHYLRRKFTPKLLLTVRGVGYQLGNVDAGVEFAGTPANAG
jgi:DNA-binding response OmpR family regulator